MCHQAFGNGCRPTCPHPIAIMPHHKWLYIAVLVAHNNFVKVKAIELVIYLWIEEGFPSPLTLTPNTVCLFRPSRSPSAARSLNSVLSSVSTIMP